MNTIFYTLLIGSMLVNSLSANDPNICTEANEVTVEYTINSEYPTNEYYDVYNI